MKKEKVIDGKTIFEQEVVVSPFLENEEVAEATAFIFGLAVCGFVVFIFLLLAMFVSDIYIANHSGDKELIRITYTDENGNVGEVENIISVKKINGGKKTKVYFKGEHDKPYIIETDSIISQENEVVSYQEYSKRNNSNIK